MLQEVRKLCDELRNVDMEFWANLKRFNKEPPQSLDHVTPLEISELGYKLQQDLKALTDRAIEIQDTKKVCDFYASLLFSYENSLIDSIKTSFESVRLFDAKANMKALCDKYQRMCSMISPISLRTTIFKKHIFVPIMAELKRIFAVSFQEIRPNKIKTKMAQWMVSEGDFLQTSEEGRIDPWLNSPIRSLLTQVHEEAQNSFQKARVNHDWKSTLEGIRCCNRLELICLLAIKLNHPKVIEFIIPIILEKLQPTDSDGRQGSGGIINLEVTKFSKDLEAMIIPHISDICVMTITNRTTKFFELLLKFLVDGYRYLGFRTTLVKDQMEFLTQKFTNMLEDEKLDELNHVQIERGLKVMLLSILRLFVDIGIGLQARSLNNPSDPIAAPPRLGFLLPIIGHLQKSLEMAQQLNNRPKLEVKNHTIQLYQDVWRLIVLFRFMEPEFLDYVEVWSSALLDISGHTPPLVSVSNSSKIIDSLRTQSKEFAIGISESAQLKIKENLCIWIPNQREKILYEPFGVVLFCLTMLELERFRVTYTGSFETVFHYLSESVNIESEIYVCWIEEICDVVFRQWLQELFVHPGSSERERNLEKHTELLVNQVCSEFDTVSDKAWVYLNLLIKQFPHLCWNKACFSCILNTVADLSSSMKNETQMKKLLELSSSFSFTAEQFGKNENLNRIIFEHTKNQQETEFSHLASYFYNIKGMSQVIAQVRYQEKYLGVIEYHYETFSFYEDREELKESPKRLLQFYDWILDNYKEEVSQLDIESYDSKPCGTSDEDRLISFIGEISAAIIFFRSKDSNFSKIKRVSYGFFFDLITKIPGIVVYSKKVVDVSCNRCWKWIVSTFPDFELDLTIQMFPAWKLGVDRNHGIFYERASSDTVDVRSCHEGHRIWLDYLLGRTDEICAISVHAAEAFLALLLYSFHPHGRPNVHFTSKSNPTSQSYGTRLRLLYLAIDFLNKIATKHYYHHLSQQAKILSDIWYQLAFSSLFYNKPRFFYYNEQDLKESALVADHTKYLLKLLQLLYSEELEILQIANQVHNIKYITKKNFRKYKSGVQKKRNPTTSLKITKLTFSQLIIKNCENYLKQKNRLKKYRELLMIFLIDDLGWMFF